MKPGEFVGVKKSYSIECFDGEGWYTVNRTHPDFPAAVAALQSLIRPSLDPRAGRVLAMREEGDGPHEWRAGGIHYRWNEELQRVEVHKEAGGWEMGWNHPSQAFEAGRRYERERGCAYVSDKPWTYQS
jgi:hypothetical protein